MNLLGTLQNSLEQGHTIQFKQVSDFRKAENRKMKVKSLYNIVIKKSMHSGIFFSKWASYYQVIIDKALQEMYNGKIYITGTTECGDTLTYDSCYLKSREGFKKGII